MSFAILVTVGARVSRAPAMYDMRSGTGLWPPIRLSIPPVALAREDAHHGDEADVRDHVECGEGGAGGVLPGTMVMIGLLPTLRRRRD